MLNVHLKQISFIDLLGLREEWRKIAANFIDGNAGREGNTTTHLSH